MSFFSRLGQQIVSLWHKNQIDLPHDLIWTENFFFCIDWVINLMTWFLWEQESNRIFVVKGIRSSNWLPYHCQKKKNLSAIKFAYVYASSAGITFFILVKITYPYPFFILDFYFPSKNICENYQFLHTCKIPYNFNTGEKVS